MKRGQEEVTGFIMIVIVVAVIGVIVLSLALRDTGHVQTSSSEVSQFLESVIYTTTSCSVQPPAFLSVAELMIACRSTPLQQCGEQGVCNALNSTLHAIIAASMKTGNERALKGQKLAVDYRPRIGNAESLLQITAGNCSRDSVGGDYVLPDTRGGGTIITTLKLCS
ncbi:MAG TPA: hypothetical protein VJK03_01470 [Candidatus Nanoarchaeia archaeon]|nr:hypothetical protein [Candidatus Nanoarchaeia archaeon]